MGDTFAVTRTLDTIRASTALIVGAGYVGLEMAEALTTRGLSGIQCRTAPEVLSTVDPALGRLVHDELAGTASRSSPAPRSTRSPAPRRVGRLHVEAGTDRGQPVTRTGRPGPRRGRRPPRHRPRRRPPARRSACGARSRSTAACAPASRRLRRRRLRRHPSSPARRHLPAAGHHRPQAGPRRGRERARRDTAFAGSLGTQVVKVFDLVAARTGLRDHEAAAAGFDPGDHRVRGR